MNKELKNQIAAAFKAHPKVDSLITTSDGNVFLPTKHGKSFAKQHAKEFNLKVSEVNRNIFEAVAPNTDKGGKGGKATGSGGDNAWRELSYGKLKEYAEKKLGLTELETTSFEGGAKLLEEIDAKLAEGSND